MFRQRRFSRWCRKRRLNHVRRRRMMETQLPDAYALLLADLRALRAELALLRERVDELEGRLHEAEMSA
jgi:hypothetical protein